VLEIAQEHLLGINRNGCSGSVGMGLLGINRNRCSGSLGAPTLNGLKGG